MLSGSPSGRSGAGGRLGRATGDGSAGAHDPRGEAAVRAPRGNPEERCAAGDEILRNGVPPEMLEFYRRRAELLRLQAMGAFAARLRRGWRGLRRPRAA